jgi:putative hydrolase of the HAD superfamily
MDSAPHRQGRKPATIRPLQARSSEARAIKVIFFDAAGTLIHLPRGVGFHYAAVAARHGWKIGAEIIGRTFGALWKAMPSPPAGNGPRADDDRGWWRELVWGVLDQCNAPQDFDRTRYFDELYVEFTNPGVWPLYPEVREVLELLAPRYELAVLSNFDGRLRPILAQLGILDRFNTVVISSEAGADKPDPQIFACAAARARITPGEALLAGDDLDHDVAGARRAGWHAFHVDRPQTTLRDLPPALSRLQSGS